MTGSKYNLEGNSRDRGEPDPGPYWRRMHRDRRFRIGTVFMTAGARYLCPEWRSGVGSKWPSATCGACECCELSFR